MARKECRILFYVIVIWGVCYYLLVGQGCAPINQKKSEQNQCVYIAKSVRR
jgi:hypothetical protein